MVKTTGKLEPDLIQLDRPSEANQKYREELQKLANAFFSNLSDKHSERLLDTYGVGYVNALLEHSLGMQEGMEALLASMIIESWTMFESLASGLWVVGVDTGPTQVRLRIANSTRLLKPDENIGAKELLNFEFDPGTNYGSSLRELGRVSFQKLDYIQRFYSIAFDSDFVKMFTDVEGGYITALSAFSNSLIHNAGKVDKKFVRKVQSFGELRALKINDQLLLDGEMVKKLRNAAVVLGIRLIQFVDGVLTPAKS